MGALLGPFWGPFWVLRKDQNGIENDDFHDIEVELLEKPLWGLSWVSVGGPFGALCGSKRARGEGPGASLGPLWDRPGLSWLRLARFWPSGGPKGALSGPFSGPFGSFLKPQVDSGRSFGGSAWIHLGFESSWEAYWDISVYGASFFSNLRIFGLGDLLGSTWGSSRFRE